MPEGRVIITTPIRHTSMEVVSATIIPGIIIMELLRTRMPLLEDTKGLRYCILFIHIIVSENCTTEMAFNATA
jgi:hypothetical protein